ETFKLGTLSRESRWNTSKCSNEIKLPHSDGSLIRFDFEILNWNLILDLDFGFYLNFDLILNVNLILSFEFMGI
ncbi:hypothetical protein, partial [Bacillus amyloliquefaciens]|uniref:hypothetical protein n=1 Tax=Bacillus amyloliquefaciens TaxID=1390 RepID=UPI00197ABEF5